jgi:hypothetical protein
VAKNTKLSYDKTESEWNETHVLRFPASLETVTRVFSFRTPSGVRVSWSYAGPFDNSQQFQTAIDNALNGTAGRAPDDISLGSGIYDYKDKWWSNATNTFITNTLDLEKNFMAAERRRTGAIQLLAHIANATLGASRVWYRNNHCNSRYPAVHADVRVEPAVHNAGGRVLDTFNFSVGIWSSMTTDDFHYDMVPCTPPKTWDKDGSKPHVGELVSQAAQSMLNRLCLT